MFLSLTQRLGFRAIDRLGLLVELSTLGEYGLGPDGVVTLGPAEERVGPPPSRPSPIGPRAREDCPHRGRFTRVGGGTARL